MTLELNGLQKEEDGTKSILIEAIDCDTLEGHSKDNWNEDMADETAKQQRLLRSGTRNQYSERPSKRMKPVSDDSLIDSDNENELVIDIDCDSSAEDTSSKVSFKDSSKEDTEQEKKYTLRKKPQSNGLVNWKSFDEILNSSEDSSYEKDRDDEKEEKKIQENSHKVHKTKKKTKHSKKHHHKENKAAVCQEKLSKKSMDANNDVKDVEQSTEKECPICHKQFADSHSFTIHIREHNTDKSTHICKICMKQLSSASSLDRHMYVHSGERPFECRICRLRFTTNGNMHRHMKTHLQDLQPSKAKKESRSQKRIYDGKMKDGSSSSSDSSYSPSEIDALVNGNVKKETPECTICGKEFLSPTSLQRHMQLHTSNPIKCSTCKTTSQNYADYLKHSCIVENKESSRYKTYNPKIGFYDLSYVEFASSKFPLIAKNICELQLRHPSSLFFSWECKTCSKAFPSNKALAHHEWSHENGGKTCVTCKCDFLTLDEFRFHQLKHRLPEQVCDQEDESQEDAESMDSKKRDFMATLGMYNPKTRVRKDKKPKMRHFDNMDYFVNNCNESDANENSSDVSSDFADIKSIISLTSKTALPNLRASPVTASPASPSQATSGTVPVIEGSANPLQNVQWMPAVEPEESSVSALGEDLSASAISETGEEFSCQKCNESYTTSSEFKDHMKTHGKGTLHMCKFCDYETNDKSTLKRHLRKHNGEHPFKCSICDYVFTTKANGHRHVRNKHKLMNQEAADAVVYNPNMLEGKDPESEPNSTETVCKYCKQDFKYNRVLRHHLRSLNNSCSRKPYSCTICKQGFSTKNNCIRHITNHHPEFRDKAKELAIVNEISSSLIQESNMNQSEDVSENESVTTEPLNLVMSLEEDDNHGNDANNAEYTPGNDAETLKVAESLVSLQGLAPPQDSPLDLTLCALNLSLKSAQSQTVTSVPEIVELPQNLSNPTRQSIPTAITPAHVEETITADPKETIPITDQEQPVNLSSKQSDIPQTSPMAISLITDVIASESINTTSSPIPIMCFPQVISPINGLINKKASATVPFVFSTPVPYIATVSNPTELLSSEKSKNLQKVKKFSCEICFKGFTLKSNRERHIKNHHPEHARPPRSRNYIPTLSPTTIQKQGSSTLSDRTRDALRVALIAKSGTTFSKNDNSAVISQFPAVAVQIPCSNIGNQLPVNNDNTLYSAESKSSDMTDLASVSAVIDTVNCQPFKEYLNKANESSDNQDVMDLTSSETSTVSEVDNGKKSSYTSSPKSIECTYCERKFPWKSSLSRHFLTHTGLKPHKCPKCPLSFTTKSNRDRHLYRQHKDCKDLDKLKDRPYQCDFCPNSFSTRGKLKKHKFLKHSRNGDSRNMLSNNSPNKSDASVDFADGIDSSSDDTMDTLDCHVCGAGFKSQHDLLSHLTEAHASECNDDSKDNGNTRESPSPCIVKVEPEDADLAMDDSSAISQEPPVSKPTAKHTSILPKKSSNSLLYLFAAAQHALSMDTTEKEEAAKAANENSEVNNNENSLILNLLGLKDPEFLDEMLDSAVRTHIKKEVNA